MPVKTWVVWLLIVFSGIASDAVAAGSDQKLVKVGAQSSWAYPKGVIVTSTGARVTAPEKKNRDDEDPPPPAAHQELMALTKSFEQQLRRCLEDLRVQSPGLQKGGAKYAFNIDFVIGPTGKVTKVAPAKRGGGADLPDCVKSVQAAIEAHKFGAPAEGISLDGHIEYEALVLNDADAQGRGFQYIANKKAWEAKVKANKPWFVCKKATDCAVLVDQCEVRAVRREAVAAFAQKGTAPTDPECARRIDLSAYRAKCAKQFCAVEHRTATE